MKRSGVFCAAALGLVLSIGMNAHADLQKIQVGGQIKIRGNYWSESWFDQGPTISRGPLATLFGRAIPDGIGFSPPLGFNNGIPFVYFVPGLNGTLKFDDQGNSVSDVEQRTRLKVAAKFSDNVSAVIEVDALDVWGEDFRSEYIAGVDGRAGSTDDVEIFQAYVDLQQVMGWEPLSLRIGRQEIELKVPGGIEEGWLVSNVDSGLFFGGVSFDAIRFDYDRAVGDYRFGLTGFWSKLTETSPIEEDGDVDFYGVEGRVSRAGEFLESELALYWLYIRDPRSREENPYLFQGSSPLGFFTNPTHNIFVETAEDIFGVDDYDTTQMHTIGTRWWGTYFPESLAWEMEWKGELAYQFGDAGAAAFAQIPVNTLGSSIVSGSPFLGGAATVPFLSFIYGDSDAEYDTFAGDVSVVFSPRFGITYLENHRMDIKGRFTYYGGEDNSEITFWERINPLARREASVSFNRLFSEDEHSDFLDIEGNLSNVWIAALEVNNQVTPEVLLTVKGSYFEVVEEFERSVYGPFWVGVLGPTNLSLLNWITRTSSAELGWELSFQADYNYSDDLKFAAGWSHFFADDGIKDGNFIDLNGLAFAGGLDDEDADYFWFQTTLSF